MLPRAEGLVIDQRPLPGLMKPHASCIKARGRGEIRIKQEQKEGWQWKQRPEEAQAGKGWELFSFYPKNI